FGVINRANVAYDVPSVVVFAADGVTPLWDSITGPGNQLFVGPDVLLDGRSIAVSPDDQWMAVMHTDSHFSVMRLTNGVPDASSLFTIANAPNPAGTANTGAQIAFDAADNIYAVSRGQTNARIWSIGATTTAFTHNDLTATNGTFVLTSPATKVTVVATTPQASQTGPVPGVFTIARSSTVSDETNVALTVSFTLSGTGTNIIYEFRDGSVVSTATNITYVTNNTVITQATYPATVTNSVITTNYAITATVTFLPNINTTNITIVPDTLSVSRPTTAVALTVKGGGNYTPAPPVKDTVFIANSGPQYLFVSGVDASTMYRGYSNDYASFVITRWGDTTVSSYSVANYTYAGTATINSDYYGAGSISMDPGVVSVTNQVLRTEIPPTGIYVGNKSIIVGLGSGGGTYTAGPNTAALTLIDNASTFTNVLFSNPLTNAADATNWVITYGTGDPTNNSANYNVDFGYDLTTDPTTTHGTIGLPPNGATTALRITCNKLNNPGAAGGVNVYLTNQMFSGNFAVHFDMNVIEGANLAFSTEGVLFGLNHTGSQSNWWYGTGPIAPQTWGSDGLWYWVSADPGGAGAGDFLEFTGAGGTNGNAGWQQPGAKPYTTFAGVYKIPTIFTSQEGNPQRSGVPANGSTFNSLANTNWSNVEIKQYKATATGYITTMSINNYNVFTYTNNTVWTNGYVMLGYADPFGGTGGTSVGYPDAAAYFSNLKVVGVPAPVIVQQPTNLIVGFGSNATFTVVATFDPTETITNGQWYLNGVSPIPSQTNQTLSFTVGKTNYGSYNWTINDGT
ncbi:MAG: hypothetical protein JF609_02730, partial [Verrucomicrobia bacterium]|nr:hypothetical protein [Verrucomicrobiota bacterium]